jgi:ankyrin repeat protein
VHEAAVRLLLEHKADVSAKNRCGETALYEATVNGYKTVVRLLLKHKTDVHGKNRL